MKTADNWESDKEDLVLRLKRAEGQLRAVRKMLEENSEPSSLIQQVSAVRGAINKIFYAVLGRQLRRDFSGNKTEIARLNKYVEVLSKLG